MVNAEHCPTCTDKAGTNWMGLCDVCEKARRERIERNRSLVRAYGHEKTEFGRSIGA